MSQKNNRTHHTAPLAEQLRPSNLAEVIGQRHLLGEGKPLQVAFAAGKIASMILWGPPGVGKTTIARLTAQAFDCEWIALSAVFSGVKDIRSAMEQAQKNQQMGKKTILFIDEIHRFNKSQQDALLPYTESGVVTLIGATTENPSFEINRALLSRMQVYVLQPLTEIELNQLLDRTVTHEINSLVLDDEAKTMLIRHADGDARRLLNLCEQVTHYVQVHPSPTVTSSVLQQVLSSTTRQFDKGGDYFYDQISALHKSVRGSDPDAALYWFCRMLDGGADPNYLARRIIRMAWEDIGLADLRAQQIAIQAANSYDRLGTPEGELALAQALIYLAIAPKSNAGYVAYNKARTFVQNDQSRAVPLHLRNAPTELMNQLGYGKNYRYAHNEPLGFAAGERYFPEGIDEPNWYQPTDRGLEIKIAEKMKFLRTLNQQNKPS